MSYIHRPPIKVGLIGYGYSGRTFHAPLIRAVQDLQLVLVASSDAAKVRADLPGIAVSSDSTAVAVSDAVDLVVIASPNDAHAPLARAALSAGKHVVIDKPFTVDLREARELVALAGDRGRVLSVFHNRRWDSDFLSVRRAIADGTIGAVTHFESHIDRFRPQVRDRWRERDGPGSGLWFDLGPHLVDQALVLFGLPDRVQANLFRQRPGARSDDWAHVVLEYPGLRVVLHASMLALAGSSRFLAHGDRGSIVKLRADRQEEQLTRGVRPGDPGWGADPDPLTIHGEGGSRTVEATPGDQRQYYEDLAGALTGSGSKAVSSAEALAVMAVIEAAVESARRAAAVALPLTAEERRSWTASTRLGWTSRSRNPSSSKEDSS